MCRKRLGYSIPKVRCGITGEEPLPTTLDAFEGQFE
jgi:hypothetical protein